MGVRPEELVVYQYMTEATRSPEIVNWPPSSICPPIWRELMVQKIVIDAN
jgi:hypothetical protein